MAMVRRSQGRLIESRMEFEAAIALDRNNARAYFNLGQTLLFLGQPEVALSHVDKALRLNPHEHTTGHTGPYHGGSIGLSVHRDIAQCGELLLVAGDVPSST
jgi:tetratricopeptide (TPR) repeat protein